MTRALPVLVLILLLGAFVFATLVAVRFEEDQRPYQFTDGGITLKPGYTIDDLIAMLNALAPKEPEPVLVLMHDARPTAHFVSVPRGSLPPDSMPAAPPLETFAAGAQQPSPTAPAPVPTASGWTLVKFPGPQPGCTGVGFLGAVYYDRLDCGFGYVQVSETTQVAPPNQSIVKVSFIDSSGVTRNTQTTTARTANTAWQFNITPGGSWAPGTVTIRVTEVDVDGIGPQPNQVGNFGETTFILNQLGASVGVLPKPGGGDYQPGDVVSVAGRTYELDQVPPLAAPQQNGVAATFTLRVVLPDGTVRGPFGPITSDMDGDFATTLPGTATAGLTADASTNFEIALSIEAVDATYTDLLTGAWAADRAGAGPLVMAVPPPTLIVENSFVSSVGWVKPGETYPFRVFVKNFTPDVKSGAGVTIPAVDGMIFTNATPVSGSGSSTFTALLVTWTVGSVPARTSAGPGMKTLVVEARVDTLGEDAQIVWKNLSTTATLTYTGGPSGLTSESHGPKVIPPAESFDTARYGDRPFPVVPVDWFDRKHESTHTGDRLAKVINSPGIPGSTRNLYQEMSYGQLFPIGTVPSSGIATRGWTYGPGFDFTTPAPQGACAGTSFKDFRNTEIYPERIHDGWYQMPGDTQYYGGDKFSAGSLAGAIGGIGLLFAIDDACGPTGKAVYDAAQIADPEIDYSDYDTDKDGVVDFFMMVFVGAGGNGVSQTSVPPYDNVWPHSTSLEFYYTDPATGLKGYISDDQLRDLKGAPLYYTTSARTEMTVTPTAFPVFVRVGPYNVNPESAVEHASVISHEYGHSLGLPDYYSLGNRDTYGDWNLMATDKSQNMDNHAVQELGWLIPRVLEPGTSTKTGWADSKVNTHRIDWKTPAGVPYALSGTGVNNGEGYVAKLPARQIIDPAEVPSPSHIWWSRAGNDFGCTPQGAHNLDIVLPELETLPAGTIVTLTFASKWDIEWDFDYGFVMLSTDGGETYQSLPSANNYTTATFNPTANACQAQYGNGLTGTSGSYAASTQDVDRLIGAYPAGGFLFDEYELSAGVGSATVLRFSYATDPGLARPGWFIDDLRITAGVQTLFETEFESNGDPDDPRVFNGGCKELTRSAAQCTDGWQYVSATDGSPSDHAYYMVMRDRSSFDLTGREQNDRDPIAFLPGLLLVYNDEAHGYGNVGVDNPPAVTPLDSQPQPENNSPNLHDAAWTDAAGDNAFSDSGVGHTDNYENPAETEVDPRFPSVEHPWRFRFNCLSFQVTSMTGENTIGPLNPPFDLQGNVAFTMGPGCAPFDYGHGGGGAVNIAPTAVAQARPTNPFVGEEVTFDGSASTDDGPASELRYAWDLDGDGQFDDATGQVVHHTYTTPGARTVGLRVTDLNGSGLSDTDTVQITVRANQPPNAVNDAATTKPNTAVRVHVLENDSDPDGDRLTVTAVTQGQKGSVVNNGDGTVTYTPRSGFNSGTDTFTYTISDGKSGSDTATVTITVSTKNMPNLQVTELQAVNNRPHDGDEDFDNDGTRDRDDTDDDNDGVRDDVDDDDDNDRRRDGRARESDKVTITATVRNVGSASAGASKTEFRLDGTRVLGLVDTGSIPAGGQRKVSIVWDTRNEQAGTHEIKATADRNGQVKESNETDNARVLSYTIQRNHVPNGSFEEDDDDNDRPDGWSGRSTQAGKASYSDGGSHGQKSAATIGNGGNAAVHGSPTWTSGVIAVTSGTLMDLQLWVRAQGTSSPARVSLVYLGLGGNVLDVVTALTIPLTTVGFELLERAVTIPTGVYKVRIVLAGFALSDLSTAGAVTFDDIGLFER